MNDQTRPILLVEDNPDHAELTMDAIKSCKVVNPVVWIEDGESALDFLYRRGKYATREDADPLLILLDIKLPGKDGIEVLKEIRDDEHFAAVPVVMLTTSNEETEVLKAYSYHANSYVVKPMNFEDFQARIRELNLYWTLTNFCPTNAGEQWTKSP